jgi:hypothetical protein
MVETSSHPLMNGTASGTFVAYSTMQQFFQKNRIRVLHISFWSVYFSFFFYQIGISKKGDEVDLWVAFYNTVSHVTYVAIAAYMNYFWFLPRFLKHKNLGRFALEFSAPFAVLTFLFIHVKRFQNPGAHYFYSQKFMVQIVVGTIFIVVFVALLKFLEDWFELEAKKKALENEKLNAELRFLKAQINPHFLFNTLNNLYALAFNQSPQTTEVIAKLSQMMRYMIYDSNHPKVPLSKEIEYMENYISLEKLRLNQQIPIDLTIEGDPTPHQIVPLILIAFLENAFKHGISNNATQAWIQVRVHMQANKLVYSIKNSKKAGNTAEHSGFGLQNVRRRLDLSYPDQYTLDIHDEPDQYTVQLSIQLQPA